MAQPTPYEREFNFSNQQAATPTTPLPAPHLDAELNRVKLTLDQTLANLALIQADDGTIDGAGLADGSVGYEQLDPAILGDLIAAGVDPGAFDTALAGSDVFNDSLALKLDATLEFIPDFPRPAIEKIIERLSVKDCDAQGDSTNGSNGTDDTDAFLEAIAYCEPRGSTIYVPSTYTSPGGAARRYKITETLDLNVNNAKMVGDNKTSVILDFASQASGPGVRLPKAFDGHLSGITILNAYGNCLEIATAGAVAPQAYAANGIIKDVAVRGSRNGWGFEGAEFFMYGMDNIRAQLNALGGFKMTGYSTTLGISRCWATANTGDGWNIADVTYSGMYQCGTDDNGGYGYVFQDAHLVMVGCGAENNDKSAIRCYYDAASGGTVLGMMLSIDNFLTIGNNAGAHAGMGHLLELAAALASAPDAGIVTLRGWKNAGSAPATNPVSGNGTFKLVAPAAENVSEVLWETSTGNFSKTSDGATDYGGNLPVNISGADITIGTLKPKQKNGLGSFGGLLVITASKNNRGSSYKGSCTIASVSFGAGSMADIDVIATSGYAGAAADEAAYTYSLTTAGALRATVAGSTTTGNCYFDVACIGDVTFKAA